MQILNDNKNINKYLYEDIHFGLKSVLTQELAAGGVGDYMHIKILEPTEATQEPNRIYDNHDPSTQIMSVIKSWRPLLHSESLAIRSLSLSFKISERLPNQCYFTESTTDYV